MVDKVYLGLGSNKGDRLKYLQEAVRMISKNDSSKILAVSPVYESLPYGNTEQDNFLNAVVEIDTGLGILTLFHLIKNIEKDLGRTENTVKWGPREIDIDILFFNNLIYETDELVVPHQDVLNRDFVLVPLNDISGEFTYPGTKSRLVNTDISKLKQHIIKKTDYTLIEA